MKNNDRNMYIKLYIAVGLCIVIAGCLFILIIGGGAERIQSSAVEKPRPVETEKPTFEPSPIPSPIPTIEPSPSPTPVPDESLIRIVNKEHTLDPSYVPQDLVDVAVESENIQQLVKEAADALVRMFADAQADGIDLILVSGYRSYETEVQVHRSYVDLYGEEYASHLDCQPGRSEHQLGLAVDLGCLDGTCRLDQCFSNTTASTWLVNNAWQYGWILRYPEGKEDITGIMYSPWNYRYVGVEEAEKLHTSGMTMEEYDRSNYE